MLSRRIELGVGVAVLLLAALILFVVIPFGIVVPRSVRSILLSPSFWPTILGVCLMACAAGLALKAYLRPAGDPGEPFDEFGQTGAFRLASFLVVIVVYYLLINPLGMVWASILAFAATVLLTGAGNRLIGLACAVLLPLFLYAFFYHVAAVPIPQGAFVRLP